MVNALRNDPKAQHMRSMFGFFFAIIAGNFVAGFLNNCYQTLDQPYKPANLLTIIATSLFFFKLLWDLFIYYNDFSKYDPTWDWKPKHKFKQYLFNLVLIIFETTIFVVGFRATADVSPVNFSFHSQVLDASTAADFSLDVGLVELTWAFWCLMYLGRLTFESPEKGFFRRVSSQMKSRKDTSRWLILNLIWSSVFLYLYRFENKHRGPTELGAAALIAGTTAVYLVSYLIFMWDYYAGDTGVG